MTNLFSRIFQYVMLTVAKHNIDESHGISHSMNVLFYANQIYQSEVATYPILKNQERLIYITAALHDMADKKYVDENLGIIEIDKFLNKKGIFCEEDCDLSKETTCITQNDINMIKNIIATMSYSTVKKNGFPNLGGYQRAYHIVREADLLTAYDVDRCMIYHMTQKHGDITQAIDAAEEIFNKRVLRHNEDGLFITDYSKQKSVELHKNALSRLQFWKQMSRNPVIG